MSLEGIGKDSSALSGLRWLWPQMFTNSKLQPSMLEAFASVLEAALAASSRVSFAVSFAGTADCMFVLDDKDSARASFI